MDSSVKADANNIAGDYHILDLNKNIDYTLSLNMDNKSLNSTLLAYNDKKIEKIAKMNAIKLDEKTLIIKGFNESIDNALLKTIDLSAKNIPNSTSTDPDGLFGTEIIPIVLDVDLSDEAVELIDSNTDITEYEVVSGDSLGSIAQKFNISIETILWANDLNSKSTIKVGQKLVILPVSGVSYKVKKGDTVSGLASRFNVTERDIVDFNKTEDDKLIVGEIIVIPGGKISSKKPTTSSSNSNSGSKQTSFVGNFARPISGGIKTQGIHGYNGIDIGAPIGTSVFASLSGTVTLTRGGNGWNGGYGNYIVIKHSNGIQTLYAHLDSISVSTGQTVEKGQVIGRSGNTGRSTGPHLHFEVRGAKNPF